MILLLLVSGSIISHSKQTPLPEASFPQQTKGHAVDHSNHETALRSGGRFLSFENRLLQAL